MATGSQAANVSVLVAPLVYSSIMAKTLGHLAAKDPSRSSDMDMACHTAIAFDRQGVMGRCHTRRSLIVTAMISRHAVPSMRLEPYIEAGLGGALDREQRIDRSRGRKASEMAGSQIANWRTNTIWWCGIKISMGGFIGTRRGPYLPLLLPDSALCTLSYSSAHLV
jgi:hypothetical protein